MTYIDHDMELDRQHDEEHAKEHACSKACEGPIAEMEYYLDHIKRQWGAHNAYVRDLRVALERFKNFNHRMR